MHELGINDQYQLPDSLWEKIVPLLPPLPKKKKEGRKRMDDRKAMTAIFYILRTGCQWKALPRSLGASSTVHDRFQFWCKAGLFLRLWQEGLCEYDFIRGIDWEWQAMDGSHIKAPLGGEATGPSPVDRAKRGTNRHLLTDGNGIPLSVVVAKANQNDMKLVQETFEFMVVEQPEPTEDQPQHICLDKGYDYQEVENIVAAWGYTAHIRRRGEDEVYREKIPHYRAHRWVVERSHSWLNGFRRMLIRWEKKVENYIALLHFACAWICFRASGLF